MVKLYHHRDIEIATRPRAAKTCSRGDAEAQRRARSDPFRTLRPGVSARDLLLGIRGPIVRNKPNSARPADKPGCRRAKTCETNPILARDGASGGPNMRNKPNLARLHPTTGWNDAKQTQFGPGGAGIGGTKCAKQTQFLDCGLRIGDCGLGTDLRRDACPAAYRLRPVQADRAKQSQFRGVPPGPEGGLCKTNPILAGAETLAGPNVRNKANFAQATQVWRPRPRHGKFFTVFLFLC